MLCRLTPSLVLCSPWRPYWPKPRERVLRLKAAGVFPPGHPSTRLCLDLLKDTLVAEPRGPLLDVGCGSGVLMLAAAALGVRRCVGVDLSRQAARLSKDNARQNLLGGAVQVAQGSTECLKGTFPVILANLPWAVQLEKVLELCRLAAPGGVLILSGFKDTQEEALKAGYEAQGWFFSRRLTQDEWVPDLPPEKSYTWVAWLLKRQDPGRS